MKAAIEDDPILCEKVCRWWNELPTHRWWILFGAYSVLKGDMSSELRFLTLLDVEILYGAAEEEVTE